jgi:regulator of protease activity HflC (stomatin/prohibitin superfamily)
MQAFDFLNDLMQWLGELAPRWDLLEPTHGGVKFKWRGKVSQLTPGRIYWWWPVTTKVRTIPIKRQTMVIGQRLTTKDEISVAANIVVAYVIDDVTLALVETIDHSDTIGEIAQKLTIKPLMGRTFDEIITDMADNNNMRNECTREAKKLLREYGVGVLDAYVSDFTETTVFSHDGDGMVINRGYEHGEEDYS